MVFGGFNDFHRLMSLLQAASRRDLEGEHQALGHWVRAAFFLGFRAMVRRLPRLVVVKGPTRLL